MKSRGRVHLHWGMLAVLALGVGCGPRGGGGDGGDGGISGGALDQIWLRYDGTSSFVQVNRSNHCNTTKSWYEDTYPTFNNDIADAADEFSADVIDEGQYNLRVCEAYREYYGSYANLYSLAGATTVSSVFSLEPLWDGGSGDDDDSDSRGWDETQDPEEGTYVSAGEDPVSGDFDGYFQGNQTAYGPNYLSNYRDIQCSESWTTESLTIGSTYEDFSYGQVTGILSVSTVSETAFRLLLTDGLYTLHEYGLDGLPTGEVSSGALSVDGSFELCDVSTTTGGVGDDDDSGMRSDE